MGMRRKDPKPLARFAPAVLAIFFLLGFVACATLPQDYPRTESYAMAPSEEGELARVAEKISAKFGEAKSGFLTIDQNSDALDWRLMLADQAQHSIDAQYFIWHGDESGILLLLRLLRAADRGIRVRLLVDDLLLGGAEKSLAALDTHPNLEVRIFNPWRGRGGPLGSVGKGFEFLGKMKKLNARMHNKVMVADNRFAIVGGRNIGNEYFGLSKKYNFRDTDVLCVGPVAAELSKSFDLYWNSESVYPGEAFSTSKTLDKYLKKRRKVLERKLAKSEKLLGSFSLYPQDWSEQLNLLPEIMSGGVAKVVYDKPLVGTDMPPVQMFEGLAELFEDMREEVFIITPYFIPHDGDLNEIQGAIDQGIHVKILTNSLGATDSPIVHSAFRRYRRPIIETGTELYELRHDAEIQVLYDTPPVRAKFLGLHSKVIIVDYDRVYVGSSNFDPRSVYLNTEVGLLIDDPVLADELARLFYRDLAPENSWRVRLDEKDELIWESSDGILRKEPARTGWQRFQVGFYSLLPIEDQL
jgi:putative cardiolipin synthase